MELSKFQCRSEMKGALTNWGSTRVKCYFTCSIAAWRERSGKREWSESFGRNINMATVRDKSGFSRIRNSSFVVQHTGRKTDKRFYNNTAYGGFEMKRMSDKFMQSRLAGCLVSKPQWTMKPWGSRKTLPIDGRVCPSPLRTRHAQREQGTG